MAYNIPIAVEGAGDPAADFNAARSAILDLETRAGPVKLMPYDTGDLFMPYSFQGDPGNTFLFDATVVGCGVLISRPCSLTFARVQVQAASGIAGASIDLVIYRADTEALVGTFGSVPVDSTGQKTATPGTPITITEPAFYLAAYRLRTTVGIGPSIRSYRAGTYGQTVRVHDFDYPVEDSFAWSVSGTGAAPASLSSYSRASGGPAASSPLVVLGVTP